MVTYRFEWVCAAVHRPTPAAFAGSSLFDAFRALIGQPFSRSGSNPPKDAMPSTLIAAGIGTAELNLRLSRAPDFEGENRALLRLAAAQTGPRVLYCALRPPRPGLGTDFCKASLMLLLSFAAPAAPALVSSNSPLKVNAVSAGLPSVAPLLSYVERQQRGANAHAGSRSSLAAHSCSRNLSVISHACRAARLRCPRD